MTVSQQALFGGGSVDIGASIADSLMFDAASSQYLSRSVTTSTLWTLSVWIKRAKLSIAQGILEGGLIFNAGDTLTAFGVTTTAVFRDVAAWYHIVVNSSGLYVNGVSHGVPTTAALTDPGIGRNSTSYFDGYLADFVFVDGSTVAYTDFGRTSPQTGVWVPKRYSGALGAKGFRLDFADETSTTTLGYDVSGNANHWTLNAMATANQYQDTPTNNYCTLLPTASSATPTYSLGNTKASFTDYTQAVKGSFLIPATGKWYWEIALPASGTATHAEIGVCRPTAPTNVDEQTNANFWFWYSSGTANGLKFTAGVSASYGDGTWANSDVIGVAFNVDAGTIEYYLGGVAQGTCFSGLTGDFVPFLSFGTTATRAFTANFGQRAFTYTPPTGFKSLCTANLPVPTIKKPTQYFVANTRTGTGATYSVTGKLFSPGLVWVKGRSGATDHAIYDAVRGVEKRLESNNTDAEVTGDTTGLTAFGSDGYTGGALAQINTNAATYVDWMWKESAISGMDIVTYTGDGANRTIAHSLGAVPKLIIVKDRTAASANDWAVYHASLTSNVYYAVLNSTAAQASDATYWNSTTPTSSVFSVGTNADVNTNTSTYVAYLFAEVAGFSKFGSYTGNGSADGTFVHCGFRPAFVMVKRTDTGGAGYDWAMLDSARNTYNKVDARLAADLSNAESTGGPELDFTANGFKVRVTDGMVNVSGGTYIYAAFAEAPTKYARAR